MNYKLTILPSFKKDAEKACKKNSALNKILTNKMNEIIRNPYHYKPLRYNLAGERRVHILKSFILKFLIDEKNKTVVFIFFGHHDNAY